MKLSSKQRIKANEQSLRTLKFLRGVVDTIDDETKLELARQAQRKINELVTTLSAAAPDPVSRTMPETIADGVASLGNVMHDLLEPYGYALLVFEPGATHSDIYYVSTAMRGDIHYVSNAMRGDMIEAMRDIVARHDGAVA